MGQDKPRILCVDDHEDTCQMLSLFFEHAGYEVGTTGDPEEALRLARERLFDLYVLDGRYNGAPRPDLCAKLLELDPGASVVIYSGAVSHSERAEELCEGARAYVAKPDMKGLVEAVKAALGGKG
ncbi:MAG: response regulator [Acidobacteria bacterium]|nr:response regulator [Acidobacteriota bacterium]